MNSQQRKSDGVSQVDAPPVHGRLAVAARSGATARPKIVLGAMAVTILVVAVAVAVRQPGERAQRHEVVAVQRGDVIDVLRESGEVRPRDPVVIKNRMEGIVEWIIEDGEWVDPGDRLFVLNGDAAMRHVTEMRTELLNAQQELALARLKRKQAEQLEEQKVKKAMRALEFQKLRHRILSTPPQGGTRLIEIHEQLLPLEALSADLRNRYESAQATFQRAQDHYLEQLDQWQHQQDAILRTQAKMDEYTIEAEADYDDTKAEQIAAHEEAKSKLAEARTQIETLRDGLPTLEAARDAAKTERDAAELPRNKLLAELEQREAVERELYVQLEIEKRGVELAKLQIDQQVAQLALDEAAKKVQDAEAAYASGAISQAQLEKLQRDAAGAASDLKIVIEKVKIAARPTPEAELTEVQLKMQRADTKARAAEQVRDRNLRTHDQRIALYEARIARLRYDIDQKSQDFEPVIEFSIRFIRKQLESVERDETARRTQLEAELSELEKQLEKVRADPPSVGTSEVGGVVALGSRWGRHWHAGDRVWAHSVLMEIFPPQNMQVHCGVNEANVRQLKRGMAATVTVPALNNRTFGGTVSMVGGIGKDKFHDYRYSDEAPFAGVTEFEARVVLDEISDELRPGMTVLVSVEVDQRQNVLHLPRRAVRRQGEQLFVLTGSPDAPGGRDVQGYFFGDDAFVIEDGLSENDMVLVGVAR